MPSRCMLKPGSYIRGFWDIFGIVVLMVDLIWLPMQAFHIESTFLLVFVNWTKMWYWSCDICFSFNTGFYSKDGKLVMRRKLVSSNYLKGWFSCDFFLVTIDWVMVRSASA